jgi:transcription termination/antitermination protein NusA
MSFGSTELVQIADAVAREKGINRNAVIEAMENAIQVAARRKYGFEHDIRAEMSQKTGEVHLYKVITVVADDTLTEAPEGEENPDLLVFDEHKHLTLSEAKKKDASLEIGSEIRDELPPIDFGRIAAQSAKQVIVQKVRDAERDVQYAEFKDKIGEIASGVVKRMEYGNVIIDFGRTEAIIRREQLIPRETFRTGDRIRAYIADVRREKSGPQIFLSRVAPEFMAKLFKQEVPEIYDGLVQLKAVARDPGSRAKIAVYTSDPSVNPILACVGVRGSRVQAVVSELQGEKVDIVEWSPDPATFVVNALSSAEVSKVVIDEDNNRIEVVVPDDQLSLAIGRRGQNVRLASQLTGWRIDIMTDDEESARRAEEFNRLSALFVEALNVEEVIAHLLVTEGFTSVEEVAFVPTEDLASIEGFDENVAAELQSRANDWIEQQRVDSQNKLREMGVKDDLIGFEGLAAEHLVKLAEGGVKSLDDFADLARDEFKELVPGSGMGNEEIDDLIMRAREHWFTEENGKKAKA